LTPKAKPIAAMGPGEVGYLITGVKEIDRIKVGDTITNTRSPAVTALPGYD
jgi:GTP-binding protein LepA